MGGKSQFGLSSMYVTSAPSFRAALYPTLAAVLPARPGAPAASRSRSSRAVIAAGHAMGKGVVVI
jgi:hypothetical protein